MEMLVFGGAKGCSDENLVSDGVGVGRSAPLHPLGGRGARGLRPSRALPGLVRREFGFPTMQESASVEMLVFGDVKGCSDEDFVSDGASVGRSAPLHPLGGRGARGLRPSRALPGAVLAQTLVPDDAGCSLVDAVSDGAGVGRSAPLHPLG